MNVKAYKVSTVVEYLKELLEEDMFLCSVLIMGEISNFRSHSSGHMYFSLVDEAAALRCCVFRSDSENIKFVPKNGDLVRAYGRISVYKKMGDVQFVAEMMEVVGDGKISQNLAALREKFQAEGIFNNNRKIPQFPSKIAVVTSPTGAAVFDIIETVKRRNPLVELIVVPTTVQGEQSPQNIADSIKIANMQSCGDLLIVGRGGGSAEDLFAFNTEIVARAVHGSDLPVISAVGHEIDYTLCDFAADMRAVTPTAAAELATPVTLEEMWGRLGFCVNKMADSMESRLVAAWNRLEARSGRLSPQHEIAKINLQWGILERRVLALNHATALKVGGLKASVSAKISVLDKISPQAVLNRGFMLARDENGKLIQNGQNLAVGQKIRLLFADLEREAEIL